MKKITFLSIATILVAFGSYYTLKDLADSMENWEVSWEEEELDDVHL